MTEANSLKLAGTDYPLQPFTLRQQRDIGALVMNVPPDPKTETGYSLNVDRSVKFVAIALSRNHPQMTAEKILGEEIAIVDITEAATQVLRFAGYLPKEEGSASTGEAAEAA
jgi:hypothetical protein